MQCNRCHGNGRVEMLEHCPVCKGSGTMPDMTPEQRAADLVDGKTCDDFGSLPIFGQHPIHNDPGCDNGVADVLNLTRAAYKSRIADAIRAAEEAATLRAAGVAARTPFRPHEKSDVDYHSGCVQTRERIVAAIRSTAP